MNKIETKKDKFDFKPPYGGNEFLNIKIDGEWIDKKLNKLYPNNFIDGTISTLCFRLESEEEEKIVWERFLPTEKTSIICPILMCPDDCDFECTLIVAEIENFENKIYWKKIGIDKSETYKNKENVGSKVKWFNENQSFEFDKIEYIKVMSEFKKQYEIDKSQYEEYSRKMN
jgi:hypothetical protein